MDRETATGPEKRTPDATGHEVALLKLSTCWGRAFPLGLIGTIRLDYSSRVWKEFYLQVLVVAVLEQAGQQHKHQAP